MRPSEEKFAFVELAKSYLNHRNHRYSDIPGFTLEEKKKDDVCLDMIVNFPECHILDYLRISGQGAGSMRSLRDLAFGVVMLFHNRPNHALKDDKYKSIIKFIKDWKIQFTK